MNIASIKIVLWIYLKLKENIKILYKLKKYV